MLLFFLSESELLEGKNGTYRTVELMAPVRPMKKTLKKRADAQTRPAQSAHHSEGPVEDAAVLHCGFMLFSEKPEDGDTGFA